MASSTRGGKRGKKKRVKMKPAESGGQIYMSKDYAKKFIDGDKRPSLHNSIRKSITDRMLSGELTPEESARKKVDIFSDQVTEAVDQKYSKKAKGGAVRGYEGGGEVCRGNGRAYQGKPKKVQVR
jgi:hypothetical protein